MDSDRWQKIQAVFHEAADLAKAEQEAFLAARCHGDPELRCEVERMLLADQIENSLLERDVAHVANEVFSEDSASPPAIEQFGRYKIRRTLGAGGMGIVYLTEREDLGSLVAIKILRDAWLSPARRERFRFEQRTLAQLNHPNIARLYDADTSPDGTPFFAMEYVEGVPLTKYCARHRSDITERLKLFREVCQAVVYAHQHAVIHRDLKPSNILVKEDGTVRLLDFGIAKQMEVLGGSVEQTMTGLRLMTPAYASPEQIRGEQVGIQTDVYSLGVVLYELLSGQLPFDLSTRTPAQAEKILTEQEPERPSSTASRWVYKPESTEAGPAEASKSEWSDLDVLCLTAMHKDPGRRYASAEALLRDVDHYLKGEPLEARPDGARYRLRKFVTRNRRAVTGAAAAVLLLAVMATFFTIRLAIARNAALAQAARTQRIQKFMTNLFQGGDEAAGPADSLRVVTLLDRGVQEAHSLNAEPAVQAELYETLGGIYVKLGKLDQANALLESALDVHKAHFGADSPEVAETLVAIGQLRSDQAKLEEAEKLTRQGLEMARRHLAATNPAVVKAMVAYGRVLGQRGAYDRSIQVLNDAVKIDQAPGRPAADLVNSLSALAETNYSAGHYPVADSLYRRVLEMHRKMYGDRHPSVAEDLGNIAAIQQDLGFYSEAEKFDRQALEISRVYYGNEHPKTAIYLTMLGRALEFENKFDESDAALYQALAIQERVYGPVHGSVAETLNELASNKSMRNDMDGAIVIFRRVVEIYRSIYGDHHYFVAIALANVASQYMDKKDYVGAEPIFRDVIRRLTEVLPPDNVNTGIARIKLGRVLLRQNRYMEAEEETHGGFDILSKQMDPTVSWLRSARKDLVAEYTGMNQPEQAAKFKEATAKQ
ncbi:MAG TPA: serine/threonine-protein kinase [Candidatus Acidoferrum sp.]|nr:serine/threonine-protein kinase [Candidatus Acidoferrum sp.]